MNPYRLATLVAASITLIGAPSSFGAVTVLPGGKPPGVSGKLDKTVDCWIGFEVNDSGAVGFKTNKKNKVIQKECGGTCTFNVSLCISEPTKKCTSPPVITGVTSDNSNLAVPATGGSAHLCGTESAIGVPIGKTVINTSATAASGGPDKDQLTLICKKNKKQKGCTPGGTTTTIQGGGGGFQCVAGAARDSACAANSAGGPSEVIFQVKADGTDLDNGWTGVSQNFPVPSGSQLRFCLSGCDSGANPSCTASGPAGGTTINGATFGPPLPLVAGGVPVCVINRFSKASITGTIDYKTGAMQGQVDLLSDVFVTDATKVCPRCEGGTCDSGTNRGKACTVDGAVTVVNSLAPDKLFHLSKGCPPIGQPVSTLTIPLPLTTGTDNTPGTGGSKPCRENEAQGVPVKDDGCAANGSCQVGNCTGDACVSQKPDPSNPSQMVCVDKKGGLSQSCCSDNTSVPCFQTRPGGPGIVRTGRPVAPTAVGSSPFPLLADGLVTVATFCEAATGNSNIDTVTGLPGPGAVIFNNTVCFVP